MEKLYFLVIIVALSACAATNQVKYAGLTEKTFKESPSNDKALELAYRYLGNECLERVDFHVQYLCTGQNIPPDFAKAAEYFPTAILTDGDTIGDGWFDSNLDYGRGKGKGTENYAPWKTDGRTQLALLYLNGQGVPRDVAKGIDLLLQGIQYEEDYRKSFHRFFCCIKGFRQRAGDFKTEARWTDFTWWSAGTSAAYLLGLIYESGGVDQQEDSGDYQRAHHWYEFAASAQEVTGPYGTDGRIVSLEALLRLSQMYFEGIGVNKDFNVAMNLREKELQIKALRNLTAEPWYSGVPAKAWEDTKAGIPGLIVQSMANKKLQKQINRNRSAISSANSKAAHAARNQRRAARRAAGLGW